MADTVLLSPAETALCAGAPNTVTGEQLGDSLAVNSTYIAVITHVQQRLDYLLVRSYELISPHERGMFLQAWCKNFGDANPEALGGQT